MILKRTEWMKIMGLIEKEINQSKARLFAAKNARNTDAVAYYENELKENEILANKFRMMLPKD